MPVERERAGVRWREVHLAGHQWVARSEEHTSELQSRVDLVCRLLLEKKNKANQTAKKPSVGIKSNISTTRNTLISCGDTCIHLNAMKTTTITSINRQTITL